MQQPVRMERVVVSLGDCYTTNTHRQTPDVRALSPLCRCRFPPWRSSCSRRLSGDSLPSHPRYCRLETERRLQNQQHQLTTCSNPGHVGSHRECLKAVFTPKTLVSLRVTVTNSAATWTAFYQCFFRALRKSWLWMWDVIQQLEMPTACWLLAAARTRSLLNICPNFLKPKSTGAGFPLQKGSGRNAGTKICQLSGLRSCTFILAARKWSKGGGGGLNEGAAEHFLCRFYWLCDTDSAL